MMITFFTFDVDVFLMRASKLFFFTDGLFVTSYSVFVDLIDFFYAKSYLRVPQPVELFYFLDPLEQFEILLVVKKLGLTNLAMVLFFIFFFIVSFFNSVVGLVGDKICEYLSLLYYLLIRGINKVKLCLQVQPYFLLLFHLFLTILGCFSMFMGYCNLQQLFYYWFLLTLLTVGLSVNILVEFPGNSGPDIVKTTTQNGGSWLSSAAAAVLPNPYYNVHATDFRQRLFPQKYTPFPDRFPDRFSDRFPPLKGPKVKTCDPGSCKSPFPRSDFSTFDEHVGPSAFDYTKPNYKFYTGSRPPLSFEEKYYV